MAYSREYKYILKQVQGFRLVSPNPSHTCRVLANNYVHHTVYYTTEHTTSLDLDVTVPSRDYV